MSRNVDEPQSLPASGELFADPALRRQVLVVLAQQINRAKLQISGQWEEGGHLVRGPLHESGAQRGSARKMVLALEIELDPYETATTPGALDIQRAAMAALSSEVSIEAAEASTMLAAQRLAVDTFDPAAAQPSHRSKHPPYSALHERYRAV